MKTSLVLLSALLLTSCAIVRNGEVGVKRTLGKLSRTSHDEGAVAFNPFITTVLKIPIRTENLEVMLDLPSKEGLNIQSGISILYHIIPDSATSVLRNIGMDYETNIILPVFRSAAADICAKFFAKDMHSGERSKIEHGITQLMSEKLQQRGFVIEAVLLKSIKLPDALYQSIQLKLQAEQDAQRMEFVLQQEKKEAERKQIAAEGASAANKILSESINPNIIKWQTIEALKQLSLSPNSKIIISPQNFNMLLPANE